VSSHPSISLSVAAGGAWHGRVGSPLDAAWGSQARRGAYVNVGSTSASRQQQRHHHQHHHHGAQCSGSGGQVRGCAGEWLAPRPLPGRCLLPAPSHPLRTGLVSSCQECVSGGSGFRALLACLPPCIRKHASSSFARMHANSSAIRATSSLTRMFQRAQQRASCKQAPYVCQAHVECTRVAGTHRCMREAMAKPALSSSQVSSSARTPCPQQQALRTRPFTLNPLACTWGTWGRARPMALHASTQRPRRLWCVAGH